MTNLRKTVVMAAGALALGSVMAAPLSAQRDPAYAAARASGKVGEQPDGYLGVVGQATAELQRLVDDINIKRRAVYAKKAQENNATVEQFAFTAGCQAVMRTVPGEKYQAPDGSWKTRTDGAPVRDPRCP
ncbi:MAG: YdbL family protein [Pseudomonadota bacterium]